MQKASSRLQVLSRPLIFKRRGRNVRSNVLSAEAKVDERRIIDAEVIHGDEQAFWCEKRWFYRGQRNYMPTWDRVAQSLILLTRTVPRVPQEAAFRIFAVFMKLLLIPRVTDLTASMLPLWTTMNMQGLIQQAKKEVAEQDASKSETATSKKTDEPSASTEKKE